MSWKKLKECTVCGKVAREHMSWIPAIRAYRCLACERAARQAQTDMVRQLAEVSAGETPGYSLGPEERIWFDSARAIVARIEGKG